jgi:hypothetical protein
LAGVLIGLGGVVVLEGIPGVAASGVGVAEAQILAREGELEGALTSLKAAGYIALAPFILGGELASSAVVEGDANQKRLNSSVDDCEKRFPLANPLGAWLNF